MGPRNSQENARKKAAGSETLPSTPALWRGEARSRERLLPGSARRGRGTVSETVGGAGGAAVEIRRLPAAEMKTTQE